MARKVFRSIAIYEAINEYTASYSYQAYAKKIVHHVIWVGSYDASLINAAASSAGFDMNGEWLVSNVTTSV